MEGLGWPITGSITRIGDTVTASRPGSGRPHHGLDIFAPAGTHVLSAAAGKVVRVQDGRFAATAPRRRAGLYVDVLGPGGIVFRYLHLGRVFVRQGEEVGRGTLLGEVAPAYTSGASEPHLHFEMRAGYSSSSSDGYGQALAPDQVLPRRESPRRVS